MNPLPFFIQFMPIVALAGTFMLIIAYDKAHLIERVRSRGIEAEGTVVEIRRNPGGLFRSEEGEGEAPVVDFTTQWGSHRHYSTNYVTPCPYQVGQQVKVWYYFRKSRREVALPDDAAGPLPGVLMRWGIVLCVLGYPFVVKKLMLLGNW